MNHYCVGGGILASNVLLRALPTAVSPLPNADWSYLQAHPDSRALAITRDWYHHWYLPDGFPWLSIARDADCYFLRFPSLADFRLDFNVREILCNPAPNTPPDTLVHLFLDQVFPLFLSRFGSLILHASAVAADARAFAFTAPSAYGKSTLAASFALDGFALLTDDCLILEERDGHVVGTPVYPSLRLYSESSDALFPARPARSRVSHYSSKERFGVGEAGLRYESGTVRLNRLYLLGADDSDDIRLEPVSPRDAFVAMLRLTFLLDVDDPAALQTEFNKIARTVRSPLFRTLHYPRRFDALSAVKKAILSDIADAAA